MIKIGRDITFLTFPNKSVDMPSLGLSVLTAAVKQEDFDARQQDHNIVLKNMLVDPANLEYTYSDVLPFIWENNLNSSGLCSELAKTQGLIQSIKDGLSLERLLAVKQKLQTRRYADVFCDEDNAAALQQYMKLLSRSHKLFNVLVSNPQIESEYPDFFLFRHINKTIDEIVAKSPAMVGVSLTSFQRPFTLWATRKLRDAEYTGKIVAGGADVTYFREKYLEDYEILDFIIYKEGEVATVELLESVVRGNQPLSTVHNLGYKQDGRIKLNDEFVFKEIPNIIPDFSDLPLDSYITNALPIQASRGCSWGKCTFCKHFTTYSKQYYESKAENVVDAIDKLSRQHRTIYFHFADDDFPPTLKNSVADGLLERELGIKALAYSRFDRHITKDMLKRWFDSGISCLEWGLESASQTILNRIKKGVALDVASKLLVDSAEVGILNKLFMFHNHPGESYEDLEASISYLRRMVESGVVRPFYEIRTPLELLEGTPLYDETFSNNNFGGNFKKAWLPRGRLVAQCGYTPNEDYNIKTKMLSYFVLEMQERLKPYNVLKMNDEAIMLDVIIEDLRSSGYDLKVHTRMEL